MVRTLKSNNNHPETGANTSGKTMAEETDPQPQLDEVLKVYKTSQWFGDGLTNTQQAKSVPPLQPANKRPRLGPALDIEIRSRTETFEKAIKKLQSEVQESFDKQADLLRAILDVLKDGNR
ncbi:hypothetical protein BKA83DRAFT_24813 [Pisolithus microcarpus]|nr:hypothetical protein BKA83DRAFT_24813 [Pisolithus microcarpus]